VNSSLEAGGSIEWGVILVSFAAERVFSYCYDNNFLGTRDMCNALAKPGGAANLETLSHVFDSYKYLTG